jgi:hypothetical protein
LIEEFFKALKTRYRYQQLQLESGRAVMIALAIESAIAWRVLLIRRLMHNNPDAPATEVLPGHQISLLGVLTSPEGTAQPTPDRHCQGCLIVGRESWWPYQE